MILLSLPFKFNAGVRVTNWIQLAPSLNIQIREHFGQKMKRKEKISEEIRKQMGEENFSYESITEIKNDLNVIKNNHLHHLEKDVCDIHKKVDAMDKRLWWILMLLVASTVVGMIGEKVLNAL